MPAVPSRRVRNKTPKNRRSLHKAKKMRIPSATDEPLSWTPPPRDSLQFQSRENKVLSSVKKFMKSVAATFPCFGCRTGPFLQPFQTQRNVQGKHEDEDREDHSEHKRRLHFRGVMAKRRSFTAARTTSSRPAMGNGGLASASKRSGPRPRNGEEALSGTVRSASHESILMQTAHHQLEKLNTKAVRDLQNSGRVGTEASGKTNREVIQEVRTLMNNLVGTVEALLIQLSHEIVSAKPSVVGNNTANGSEEEMNGSTVVDCLGQNLNHLRHTISEHFFQAITLLPSSLPESAHTTERFQTSLQSLAFDYIHLQDQLIHAEQTMVNRIHSRTPTINTTDQEEKRKEKALKLMEAASSNVIELQQKVLRMCCVDQSENEAYVKESADLDLHLQLSWTWLQALQQSIGILYPENETSAFDSFMDTLLTALEDIVDHYNKPHENNRGSIDEVLYGVDLACGKRIITSLSYLYYVFDQAMRGIQQNPALEITDFPQIEKVCEHFVSLLKLLRSQLTSTSASTDADHHIVTNMVEELIRNMKNSGMTFLSHEDALVQDLSNDTVDLDGNPSFPTPFANPENHPMVLESIDDPSGSTDEETANDGPDYDLVRVEDTLLLDDESLDLSLGPLPSSGFFTRVNIDEVAEARYLDQGSSGLVTRRKLGNLQVAVKESKCPDPIKRLKRLNREATMHKNLNSCINIVRFVGRLVKPDEHGEDQIVGIITEWCDRGDLCAAIEQAAWIQGLEQDGEDISALEDLVGYRLYKDWNKRLAIVVDIATAMIYMHTRHTVHRDLYSRNVLLYTVDQSGEFGAKVCDLERARYLPGGQDVPRTNSCANSGPWMGPEVLQNKYYGLKADVYSIGTILWELMYLDNPWFHLQERLAGAPKTVIQHLLTSEKISLSFPDNHAPDISVFPQLVALVKSTWKADPSERPTMTEFVSRLREINNSMNI